MYKSTVEVVIDKHQSLRIILKGSEGFPVESSYEDVKLLVAQKMTQDAQQVKMERDCRNKEQAYAQAQACNSSVLGAATNYPNRY